MAGRPPAAAAANAAVPTPPIPVASETGPCLVAECRRPLAHRAGRPGGRQLLVCLGHPPSVHDDVRRVVTALEGAGFQMLEAFGSFRCPTCGTHGTAGATLVHDQADCAAVAAEKQAQAEQEAREDAQREQDAEYLAELREQAAAVDAGETFG